MVDAFAIVLVGLGGLVVVAVLALVLHLASHAKVVVGVVGAGVFGAWAVVYFVAFWCTTGQTPGARVMRFRVVGKDGATIGPLRAVVRYVGMLVSAIVFGLGFLPIPFDERRRGAHDRVAGTLVVDTPEIGDPAHADAIREISAAKPPGLLR
jgi:uncharacterized RDD family membrane protein YckC